ncbi:ATP-dependent DNA ligase [Diaminobutyricibacter sp. McL0618]|uniref:DUF7882 family protein n=1 Tax=Leifsonia sp. McL0618 TaxID=3415677 RepID=UPI003CED8617
MGTLYYGASTSMAEFDDRVLAHLQMAIVAKLRRGESFVFSWDVDREKGSGSHSLWISPTIPLRFTYQAGRRGPINRSWVDALVKTANSVPGLRIVDEPSESVQSASRDDE